MFQKLFKTLISTKGLHAVLLFSLLLLLLVFSGSEHSLRQRLQLITFDAFNILHQRPAADLVTIVDVDEASLKTVGQWPWPRTVMADLVSNLNGLGAKVIGFDMVFAEADRTSPAFFAEQLKQSDHNVDARLVDRIQSMSDHDTVFSEQIKSAGNVVTGFTGARLQETLRMPQNKVAILLPRGDELPFYLNSHKPSGVLANLTSFSQAAAGNGSFIATPDIDGIMRNASLFISFPNPDLRALYEEYAPDIAGQKSKLYPMLALDVARVYGGGFYKVKANNNNGWFDLPYNLEVGRNYTIPVDASTQMRIHYRDIDRENEYISAYQVLDPQYHQSIRDSVQDKIIMVGTSAEGLRDIRSTPLGIFIPGVEVHVNVIEQIIQGHYLIRTLSMIDVEGVYMLAFGLFIILFTANLGVFFMGAWVAALIALGFFGAFLAYKDYGLLFDPAYPAIVLSAIYFMTVILNYIRIEADRKQVKQAFGLYIAPSFLSELSKNPDKLKLGGESKDLTILFSDIRNFTSISENLTPEELIQLMNEFLTPMSDLVMSNRGTIDKYMGDAMMAFWNAPLDDDDHARHACQAALQMQDALIPINKGVVEKALEDGREPILLKAGIGINTGPCSVGNMGSRQRFAYSALGDAVNLASRLEGQTKLYGASILAGEQTAILVPDFAFLELDIIQVKGKEKPERIYALLGDEDLKQAHHFVTLETMHTKMIEAYRGQDFKTAREAIKDCLTQIEGYSALHLDEYYQMMQKRIASLSRKNLPEDWDGVFVATTK